jgi:simple sugar transport system permease protein
MFLPIIALIVLLLFNLFMTPGFFSIQMKDGHLYGSLFDILRNGTPLILISLGMTVIIATQGIDISVGTTIALSAVFAASVIVQHGSVPVAILAGVCVGIVCGAWNGLLVSYIGIQPMVGTLILYIVGRGIAQLVTSGQILTFTDPSFIYIGTGYLLFPIACYVAVVIIVLMYLLTRKTSLGLFVESIGVNRTASRYSGINAKRVIFFIYVISGILASVAGILISTNVKCADANNAGLWMELDAILATVIGGTSMNGGRFYLGGTVIGALFIQTLTTTIYTLGVPVQVNLVVKAVIVIAVCLIQTPAFQKMFFKKKPTVQLKPAAEAK